MSRDVRENAGERTELERLVIGDRHVVLAAIHGRQAHVPAALARSAIAQSAKRFRKFCPRKVARQIHQPRTKMQAASGRQYFFANRMQTNNPRRRAFVEMAADSLAHIFAPVVQRIRLSEYRNAEGARRIAALGGLFDEKDYFAHPWSGGDRSTESAISSIGAIFSSDIAAQSPKLIGPER
jgi:hypothetical protein